jgi:uncharacterized oligopeptide transporter (OPT) family protein
VGVAIGVEMGVSPAGVAVSGRRVAVGLGVGGGVGVDVGVGELVGVEVGVAVLVGVGVAVAVAVPSMATVAGWFRPATATMPTNSAATTATVKRRRLSASIPFCPILFPLRLIVPVFSPLSLSTVY